MLDVEHLALPAASCTVLRGRSGSGKTTLLNLIAGVSLPTAGTVQVDDTDIFALSEADRDRFRAEHIGYVFQTFNLLAAFSALENVTLAMIFAGAVPRRSGGGAASFWRDWASARGCPQAAAPVARRAATGRHCARAGEQPADDPRRRTCASLDAKTAQRGPRRLSGRLSGGGQDTAPRVARRAVLGAADHVLDMAELNRAVPARAWAPSVTILTVALKYLRGRLLASALTVLSIALGVGLIIASSSRRGIREGFIEGTTDYSLVVGAKGSPTQLVLNVVFRMDSPTPNISMYTLSRPEGRSARRGGRARGAWATRTGLPLRGDDSTYFAAFPWRRQTFASRPAGSFATIRRRSPRTRRYSAPRRRADGIADRRSVLRGRGDGRVSVDRGRASCGRRHSADDRAIFFSLPSYWEMNEIARGMEIKPLTAVLVRPKRMSDLPGLHRGSTSWRRPRPSFPARCC